MNWEWQYLDADGQTTGSSHPFDNRGDAETWIGESFGELVAQGIEQVRLVEDGTEKYVMSLLAE